jgi:hypothetical protein
VNNPFLGLIPPLGMNSLSPFYPLSSSMFPISYYPGQVFTNSPLVTTIPGIYGFTGYNNVYPSTTYFPTTFANTTTGQSNDDDGDNSNNDNDDGNDNDDNSDNDSYKKKSMK